MGKNVFVLTYHSIHVDGTGYATNDHIGFAKDIEYLHQAGFHFIGLERVIDAVISGCWDDIPDRSVALTMDDGSWFDWYDLPHPSFGKQRSMVNILRDFQAKHGRMAQPELQVTSFVIGSPKAREELDKTCMIGKGWWKDDWWAAAHAEGLAKIANHSWDHRHASLPSDFHYPGCSDYGHFNNLSNQEEADWQIYQAQEYLRQVLGTNPLPAFAYPYGEVPEWVATEYFPAHGESMGILAAFTTKPEPVCSDSDRWRLPRYVFRNDWSSLAELEQLLG